MPTIRPSAVCVNATTGGGGGMDGMGGPAELPPDKETVGGGAVRGAPAPRSPPAFS